ncbi:MAG TPA: hypothetical protein PKB06_05610, partial [Actinotalea sp.]|nr:hypothetical protein [Actinotalea sp.]
MPVPPSGSHGAGRRVAMLTGGVDVTHPDLAGARVSVWPGGLDQPLDDLATGYASLLVGQGRAHVRGVVPDARLLVAPVPSAVEPGADLVIARAVRWAVRQRAELLELPFGRSRF